MARRNPNLLSRVPADVRKAAADLRSAGTKTRTNLVGGAVVDLLAGRVPKDWDVEVFGLSFDNLLSVASRMGKANAVGRSFGIVKLTLPSETELDLSIPRRDNKVGIGHKGFEATLVPNMSNKEAARRRDFTINSLAVDLKTGRLIDPFNGLGDLKAGTLRATDPKLFVQDPMRALRAMQLLARKAKRVHPDTLRLIKGMKHTAKELSPERVLEEWRKLLLKADRPSVGLDFLKESEWIENFPELVPLESTPQHPDWHPEGDVWVHTKQIVDAAAQTRHRVPEHQREGFVFGAMLHDVGKPVTTVTPEDVAAGRFPKERLYTAHAHDAKGAPLARQFMERMKASKKTTALAEVLVGAHIQPYTLKSGKAGRAAYARLSRKLRKGGADFGVLAVLSQCDACATGQGRHFHHGEPDWEHESSQNLLSWAEEVDTPKAAASLVQGRDLIRLGHKPGPAFKIILDFAQSLQDTGMGREAILEQVVSQYPVVKKNPWGRRAQGNSSIVDSPRDLREQISWRAVQEGTRPDLEEEISWRGPTKQPFLSLWERGWRKYKARHPWGERVMVLHFWMSPEGEREHIKIKNSPLDQGAVPLKNPWKESDREEHSPCRRCSGLGEIDTFRHVERGVCFRCGGSGLGLKDWRSSAPKEVEILGQKVQIRRIKKNLYALVRVVDFEEHGTPGVHYVGTTFRLVGSDVVGDLPGGLVRVPWPVLHAAKEDWHEVMIRDWGDERVPQWVRAKRVKYKEAEHNLSVKLTQALQAQHDQTRRSKAKAKAKRNPKRYGSAPTRAWAESELRKNGFYDFTYVGKENHPTLGPVLVYTAESPSAVGHRRFRINVGRFRGEDRLDVRTARANPKFAGFMGTTHFQQRVQQRSGGLSKRKEKKLQNLYSALKTGQARLGVSRGKYAIQFGGEPGRQGDYLVVEVDRGRVVAFVSLLVDQNVGVPDTGLLHYAKVMPPEPRGTKARNNSWALAGRLAWKAAKHPAVQDLAVDLAKRVGRKTWQRLMLMSREERADWIQEVALGLSWAGGPATRALFGAGRRIGAKQRRQFSLWVAEAMEDPEVQAQAVQAARAGVSAASKSKYAKQIAAANPAQQVWEEQILKNGTVYDTLHFDEMSQFWRMIQGEDPQEDNQQVVDNWRSGSGWAETWYVDGVGNRWTLKFRKVDDPRRHRQHVYGQTNPRTVRNPRKKSVRELAVSTLVKKTRAGDSAAQRELGRRGLGLTGKPDSSLCGYCGSSEPLTEDVHLGYRGWPCCPDCGGV